MAEPVPVTARSIDEVAVGALPEVRNIAANEAMIFFRSSKPLACSVVFGESPAFGRIATDDDMDGGARSDHHPILSGLMPDTEYYFRVQGTGSDGTLYLGAVRTFRTALASPGPQDLAHLDAGTRVVAVSSNYGGSENHEAWGANGALDGSSGSAWSSAGDGDDAFLEIELANRTKIREVLVWSRSMSDGTARIKSFTLTDDVGIVHGPFDLPDAETAHRFPLATDTRTLRLEVVESTGGNTGLVEFGVFGD